MTSEDSPELRIVNAGLILYWPFLTRYFEELAMLEEGEFIDNESRHRAALLLQYLAYEETEFHEYELVLNKLLVGMEIDDHLYPSFNLTEAEYELSESLKMGLISNWDKVKTSSPEAIQGTFLQREGILTLQEDHMVLKVKRKSIDVLMRSIPWSIAVVQLPWMPYPIHVEWI